MSDANRVNVAYAAETVAGELPPVGTDWQEIRLTSEDLTGSALTTESTELRSDRIPGNLVKTASETVGGVNIEMSHGTYDDLILAAMCDTGWTTTGRSDINAADAAATMTGATKTIGGTTDWAAQGLEPGMVVTVGGFSQDSGKNNGQYNVGSISGTNLTLVRKFSCVDEGPVSVTVDWTAPPNEEEVKVGVVDRTFSIEKQYEDVPAYLMMLGAMVGEMSLSYQYQQILTGRFAWRGRDALPTTTTSIPVGATINPKSTDEPLNASSDVASLVVNGVMSETLIVQQMDINLNNGLRDVVGIGSDYPLDTNKGRSLVEGTVNMYMSPEAWTMYQQGLTLTSAYLSVMTQDANGKGLEIIIPNAVITGPAPPASGIDTDVMYQATLRAQYDATFGSHIVIRRSSP